jgi:hypothetical protein
MIYDQRSHVQIDLCSGLCRDLRSTLTVITCFTIAHSITLALATLDIVRLPGRIVEPMIAASMAIEKESLFCPPMGSGGCRVGRQLLDG